MSYQKVVVQGRIAKDPEIKQAGDTTIVNFSVPVDYRKKGEKFTQWFNCVAFGKTADVISEYFPKGKPIIVEGELQTDEHDGKKYTKLIANRIGFVDSDASAPREDEEGGLQERPVRTAKPAAKPVARTARQAKPESDDGAPPWTE